MKRITAVTVCLLASLAAIGSASAQDSQARANIPFDFYVNNTWLPAGAYTMASDGTNPQVIRIVSADKKTSVMSLTQADDKRPGKSELVFRKIGDQYFLHEVLSGHLNAALPTSRQERNAQTREASAAPATDVYLALLR